MVTVLNKRICTVEDTCAKSIFNFDEEMVKCISISPSKQQVKLNFF